MEVYNLLKNKRGKTFNSSNLNGVHLKTPSLEFFTSFPIDVILHRKSGTAYRAERPGTWAVVPREC